MKRILILSLSAIALFFISCSKHADDLEDTTPKATIHFYSPVEGATFSSGDSINITATAISTATVHGYDLIIRKLNDTTKIYSAHIHDHNDTLQVNTKWKATVSNAVLEAEIVLALDHSGHTAAKKTSFRVL